MNYFAIDVRSNMIIDIIASTSTPTSNETIIFIPATSYRVSQYYERKEWGVPVDLHAIIPKPKPAKIPEIIPLATEACASLRDYVSKSRHRETVEHMAWTWRVSEATVRDVMEQL